MKFNRHGYKIYEGKENRYYPMTMGEMKITLLQEVFEKGLEQNKIRLVSVTEGEVTEYENAKDFLLADFCNPWCIKVHDIHTVHMNKLGEDITVIVIEDDEPDEDTEE